MAKGAAEVFWKYTGCGGKANPGAVSNTAMVLPPGPVTAAGPTSAFIQSAAKVRDLGLLLAAAVKQFEIPPLEGANSL